MNKNYEIFGKKIKSPFILGSGPLTYGSEGIKAMFDAGIDVVVTKTIRIQAAENPQPHMMMNGSTGLINNELWSDYSYKHWIKTEFPSIRNRNNGIIIASLGHTLSEIEKMLGGINHAGVDGIELVSYKPQDLIPMLKYVKKHSDLPVIVKLPSRMNHIVEMSIQLESLGAYGITACDSVGPGLRIDINTRMKRLGGEGTGWITGGGILPITLYNINEIKKNTTIPIIGIGGCMSESDAIEMMLAGASYVGICSYPIIKGAHQIKNLINKFEKRLDSLEIDNINELIGCISENTACKEKCEFDYDKEKCIFCKRCEVVCSYNSRKIDTEMYLDRKTCRGCGLCVSVCPTDALTFKKSR